MFWLHRHRAGHIRLLPLPSRHIDQKSAFQQRLAEQEQQLQHYRQMLETIAADFCTYRQRAVRQQETLRAEVQAATLSELILALDHVQRAVQEIPETSRQEPYTRGLLLTIQELVKAFAALGVHSFGQPGEQFNPYLHHAIAIEPCSHQPEGTLLHILCSGYGLQGRLIQPAQVVVAVSGSEREASSEQQKT